MYPEFLPYGKNSGYRNRRVGLTGIKVRNGMDFEAEKEPDCRRGAERNQSVEKESH